jgi:hypothetical protein
MSALAKGKFNTLQDYVVDFAALLEGRFPQCLMHGLGQIKAGVDGPGPPLAAAGLP